jgi:hypothetical protein
MAKRKTTRTVVQGSQQPPAAIREPTRADIQERAYYRYVDRGRVDGFDREDWHLAESELRAGEQPVREPVEPDRVRQPTAAAAVRRRTSDAVAVRPLSM